MPVTPGLEWTFNTVAEEYERWSPTYPEALYRDIFAYQPVGPESELLEVGIGTGQATRPFLETGCALTAVELGDRLAAIAREKFQEFPKLSVVNLPFQEYDGPDARFDLIYSARAFHWIPEEIGYRSVYRMLKPGGAFARFSAHSVPARGMEAVYAEMQRSYDEFMYEDKRPDNAASVSPFTMEQAARRTAIGAKYGFEALDSKLYIRERTYTAEEYIRLIGVYSDHIVLPEERRQGLLRGIREAIEAHGGTFTLEDAIELNLHRKPHQT